uniref:6-phosphogluconate dehydrogenase, decarboxylating n=1 Tax=Gorilla gorilla gorilla TaxID=9595 RepID=A0A2I2YKS1_GORGO
MAQADIVLIGLAVMGQNLILTMKDYDFVVCAFNRTVSKVDDFLANEAKGTKVVGAQSLKEMVSKLKKPQLIILLVKAGQAVDYFIKKLVPLLDIGDIIIDGGNSEYRDTTRQCQDLKAKGILFVGNGVSGGEEGAYRPLCEDGYGDMQLICEAYHLMKDVLGMAQDKMAQAFEDWNKTELDSFLIEITANILKFQGADGKHLLPKIRDSAGQKGMGKWTTISALEYGIPVTLIGEAVFARCLSSLKDGRIQASKKLKGPQKIFRMSLYTSKIVSYAQGFMLLRQGATEFGWTLNYGDIALMWRGGCIIRSVFLGKIKDATSEPPTGRLLKSAVENHQDSWWWAVSTGVQAGIPMPCFVTALSFYDKYRHEMLPANLIQAQRDSFGAHTYELLAKPGQFIHTNWTGHGGSVSSSSYNA